MEENIVWKKLAEHSVMILHGFCNVHWNSFQNKMQLSTPWRQKAESLINRNTGQGTKWEGTRNHSGFFFFFNNLSSVQVPKIQNELEPQMEFVEGSRVN